MSSTLTAETIYTPEHITDMFTVTGHGRKWEVLRAGEVTATCKSKALAVAEMETQIADNVMEAGSSGALGRPVGEATEILVRYAEYNEMCSADAGDQTVYDERTSPCGWGAYDDAEGDTVAPEVVAIRHSIATAGSIDALTAALTAAVEFVDPIPTADRVVTAIADAVAVDPVGFAPVLTVENIAAMDQPTRLAFARAERDALAVAKAAKADPVATPVLDWMLDPTRATETPAPRKAAAGRKPSSNLALDPAMEDAIAAVLLEQRIAGVTWKGIGTLFAGLAEYRTPTGEAFNEHQLYQVAKRRGILNPAS